MTGASSRQRWDWQSPRVLILAALAIGIVLRLAVVPLPIFYHTDEIWQYMEPAHHLAGGRWVIPWEYREGIRSWLIPAFLALPSMLGSVLSPDGQLHVLLQKLLLVALSLTVIASAAGMGLRLSRLHGLFAGLVAATWFELAYFAPRAMSESMALALVFPALYLLSTPLEGRTRRVMLAAGALLGLTFCVRFHLAPALLVLSAFSCGKRVRDGWLPLIVGGIAALALGGVVDALAGQTPMLWIVKNFVVNIVEDKSAYFGTEPFYWYIKRIGYLYGLMTIPGVILVWLGARLHPAVFWAAMVNLIIHSAIPHKEERFVLFSTILFVFLASLGTAEALRRLSARWPRAVTWQGVVTASMLWIAVSIGCAFSQPFVKEWHRNEQFILSQIEAGRDPAPCGLALLDPRILPGGMYTYYDRDTPMYLFIDADAFDNARASRGAFNLVVSEYDVTKELGSEYALRTCPAPIPGKPRGFCLYARPGQCTTSPEAERHEINAVLARHDY